MVFTERDAEQPDNPLQIACGQCIGCRLEKSRAWALRCMHEAQLYDDNCFITLTFDDENIIKRENPGSVDIRDFQLFMKKLRRKRNEKIRYFHCGEYGEKTSRPHYHAILFNCNFRDRVLHNIVNNNQYYISNELRSLWPYGNHFIGECTFQSAAYVARYCLKKNNNVDQKDEHYTWVDEETGEVRKRNPEYASMSRRPGIGKGWFDKYIYDIYPKDFVTMNGVKYKPGAYYDKQLEITRPFEYDIVKEKRNDKSREREDETRERLDAREKCHQLRANKLLRKL